MADVQWSRVLFGCLTASLLALASCGDGQNGEIVHLHIFNAYPGSGSISVYGPSGVIARDLPFGERTADPVAVDRNLGNEFTILIDGAPQAFETQIPVWSMYPHETGTVLFKRRTGEATIDNPVLYRHVQTGFRTGDQVPAEQRQESCRLVLDNALSGQSGNLMNMTYIPALKINPSCVGYRESIGSFSDPRGASFIQRIADNPWFYPVEVSGSKIAYIKDGSSCPAYGAGPNGEVPIPQGTFDFVWAGTNYTSWAFDEAGSVRVPPTTGDLMDCLGWDPEQDAADQQDVITPESLAGCLNVSYQTEGIETNPGELRYLRFPVGLGDGIEPGRCGFDIRADSDFESIFTGSNLNGEPVIERAEFAPNQYYFWVLYGRPVNPFVETWGSNQPDEGGGFVDLPDYPNDPSSSEGQ
ncbi:MAG: hypothetical protein ACQEVA_05215 [Myxococcota bacterium]